MNHSCPYRSGVLAGLFLAAGLVLSAMLATAACLKVKNSRFVTVKGSAREKFKADLSWRGPFSVEAKKTITAVVTATFA